VCVCIYMKLESESTKSKQRQVWTYEDGRRNSTQETVKSNTENKMEWRILLKTERGSGHTPWRRRYDNGDDLIVHGHVFCEQKQNFSGFWRKKGIDVIVCVSSRRFVGP